MEDTNGKYRSAPAEVPDASQAPDEVEVAVVGAGPAGLTAAAMLAGYGVRVAEETNLGSSFFPLSFLLVSSLTETYGNESAMNPGHRRFLLSCR